VAACEPFKKALQLTVHSRARRAWYARRRWSQTASARDGGGPAAERRVHQGGNEWNVGAFEILAEIAIGVAGFGSLAIVLGRDRAGWESADFFRTASLFMSSFGALFLALLPIGLAMTQLAGEWIWRTSSAAMLAYIVAFSAILLRWRRRRLDPELWFGPVLFFLVAGTTAVNIIAQALNSSGLAFEPSPACYFFGVVWFLAYGCLLLMRIVFLRPPPR